jgi:LysM repeat protein
MPASSFSAIPAVAAAGVSTPPSAPPSFASSGPSSYGSGTPGSYGASSSPPSASSYGSGLAEPSSRSTSSGSSGNADVAASLPAYAAATAAPARQASRRPAAAGPAEGEWSQPQGRRSQAYPNLGSRMRFKGVSPLLIGAFVLALAALVLFLLPGFLSNHGGGGGGGHKQTPTAIAQASESAAEPTPEPSPTPRTYTVKSGDNMTKIAQRYSVTPESIGCYNNLTNINALQVGQVLLIPPADYACPSASPSKKH